MSPTIRRESLATRELFLKRLWKHGLWALGLLSASFAVGMFGFHEYCHQTWIDAFLTTCMLLGGMGPIGSFEGDEGKLFAGFYGLFSGFIFLGVSALVIAPFLHRVLHRWHLEE